MYAHILVPVDGSEASKLALGEAIKLAKRHGSKIRLLHVVNESILASADTAPMTANVLDYLAANGKAVLSDAQSFVQSRDFEAESVLVESIGGRAAERIVEQANRWPADLIVMGTHGRRGLARLIIGSDAELVLRYATMPVLMVRSPV